jgi:hypothetical protein
MATRGRIGLQLKDGSVLSAYHHWDSYPEWLGKQLVEHYPTRDKVAELIDGGDMSSAYTNAGFNNETLPKSQPLYYTMRGEKLENNLPRLDSNLSQFLDKDNGEEYHYLYTDKGWIAYQMNSFEKQDPEVVSIPTE